MNGFCGTPAPGNNLSIPDLVAGGVPDVTIFGRSLYQVVSSGAYKKLSPDEINAFVSAVQAKCPGDICVGRNLKAALETDSAGPFINELPQG